MPVLSKCSFDCPNEIEEHRFSYKGNIYVSSIPQSIDIAQLFKNFGNKKYNHDKFLKEFELSKKLKGKPLRKHEKWIEKNMGKEIKYIILRGKCYYIYNVYISGYDGNKRKIYFK